MNREARNTCLSASVNVNEVSTYLCPAACFKVNAFNEQEIEMNAQSSNWGKVVSICECGKRKDSHDGGNLIENEAVFQIHLYNQRKMCRFVESLIVWNSQAYINKALKQNSHINRTIIQMRCCNQNGPKCRDLWDQEQNALMFQGMMALL